MGWGGWYSCVNPAGQPLASLPPRHKKLQVPTASCTAQNPYRKIETNIPIRELHGLSPIFHIHVSVSDLYIPTIGLPIFCCRKIGGPILGICKSLTDTWMIKFWQRPRNCFSGNTLMGFSLQCGCCSYVTKSTAPVSSCTLIQVFMMEKLLQLSVNFPAVQILTGALFIMLC